MAAMADESAQKKGICGIIYFPKGSTHLSPPSARIMAEHIRLSGRFVNSLPYRYACNFICYDDPQIDLFTRVVRMAVGKSGRLRLRAHKGSDIEHEYYLTTFGIPASGLLQRAAKNDTTYHEHYIKTRREIDGDMDKKQTLEELTSGIVVCPKPSDVLIGSGLSARSFPGTQTWNKLLHANMEHYLRATTNAEKQQISAFIVSTIQSKLNGRILQRTSAGWQILDDATARLKAATALRARSKNHNPNESHPALDRPDVVSHGATAKRPRYA